MVATLIGKKEISAKDKREFTIAYIVFNEKETAGQACKDCFLDGHNIPDALLGQQVNVEVDFKGRVTEVTAA